MRRGQILPSAFIKKNAKSIEAETTSPKENFDVATYSCAALGEGPYAKPCWNRLIAEPYMVWQWQPSRLGLRLNLCEPICKLRCATTRLSAAAGKNKDESNSFYYVAAGSFETYRADKNFKCGCMWRWSWAKSLKIGSANSFDILHNVGSRLCKSLSNIIKNLRFYRTPEKVL